MTVAFFAGSFDPITLGHLDIIERSVQLFSRVIVGIGKNSEKVALFSLQKRLLWLKKTTQHLPQVETISFDGLAIDAAAQYGATHLIRGLRNEVDVAMEKDMAAINYALRSIDTIFFMAKPQYGHLRSSLLRDIIRCKKTLDNAVPHTIELEVFSSLSK